MTRRREEEAENEEKEYSKFRDLDVPNMQNTLQSASWRHSRGDYDGAESLLDQVEKQVDQARSHIAEDRESSEDTGERSGGWRLW